MRLIRPERTIGAGTGCESMTRRLSLLAALLFLAVLAYAASPYVAVARFGEALARRDAETVIARIDTPAIRSSIARQVARQVLARNPQLAAKSPLGPQAAGVIAASAVNAYLAETFSPQALAEMLGSGQLPAGLAGTSAMRFPALPAATDLAGLLRRAGFTGITAFGVSVPSGDGEVALAFRLRGTTWMLSSVNLPNALIDRLASEIGARLSSA